MAKKGVERAERGFRFLRGRGWIELIRFGLWIR